MRIVKYLREEKSDITPFSGDLEKESVDNNYFRKVLFTGKNSQLVVMCLEPGEDIGNEVHPKVDQFFRIEEGKAKFVLNNKDAYSGEGGSAALVPAGTYHNVVNMSKNDKLKLYTIYSPPNHPPGTIHKTKEEAEKAEKKYEK